MSRVVAPPTGVVLVFPTGEAGEIAWRDALHARGEERTPDEEAQYQDLVEKHGDPDFTIDVYADFLRLHAKQDTRTEEETIRYRQVGDRFKLHGRPELRRFDLPQPASSTPCSRVGRGRAPRSRRLRSRRTSHGPPGRSADDDEPSPALAGKATANGRCAPALLIRVPLEGEPSIVLDARTRGDEIRLRSWLRRTQRIVRLHHALEGLLDDLDDHDRWKWSA